MYYLYILRSSKKHWHYIGTTDNIAKRMLEHNLGKVRSTRAYRPLQLVYREEYFDRTSARKREIFLKRNFKAREQILANITAPSSNG